METKKVGAVTFTHNQSFSGEIEISRGDVSIKVAFSALEEIVSQKVRQQAIEALECMDSSELLSLSRPPKKQK